MPDYDTLDDLQQRNEEMSARLSLEQKKSLMREAKKRYGKDWRKLLNVKSGMDWQALKFKLY